MKEFDLAPTYTDLVQFIEPYDVNWIDSFGNIVSLKFLAGDLVMVNMEKGVEFDTTDLYFAGGIDLFNVPNKYIKLIKQFDENRCKPVSGS